MCSKCKAGCDTGHEGSDYDEGFRMHCMRGTLQYILILLATHMAGTVTPTLQVRKLRLKGMVSYLPCKNHFFFPCRIREEDDLHTIRKVKRLLWRALKASALKDV